MVKKLCLSLLILCQFSMACSKRVFISNDDPVIEKKNKILVTLKNGKKYYIKQAFLKEDFINGVHYKKGQRLKQIKINLENVETIELVKFDGKKSLLAITGTVITVLVILKIVFSVSGFGIFGSLK